MKRVLAKKSFVGTGTTACSSGPTPPATTPPCVTRDFYMAQTEVTYELWNAVHTWATHATRGTSRYTFDSPGRQGGKDGIHGAVGTNQHPVTTINWYDAIKFSNALTEYYNATNGASADLTLVYGANNTHRQAIRTVTGINSSTTVAEGNALGCSDADSSMTDPHILNCLTPNTNATGFRLPSLAEWQLAARFYW